MSSRDGGRSASAVTPGEAPPTCADHQEFVRFLNAVERAVPAGKLIHAIADSYATHKHPKARAWLERHPRWVFHFTPTSASWINAVEGFFPALTRRRLRRGVFQSVADLDKSIARYIQEHNVRSSPFVWTRPTDIILDKLARLPARSDQQCQHFSAARP